MDSVDYMDFNKLKSLPKLSKPRQGRLTAYSRSNADLSEYEENVAKQLFELYVGVNESGKFL